MDATVLTFRFVLVSLSGLHIFSLPLTITIFSFFKIPQLICLLLFNSLKRGLASATFMETSLLVKLRLFFMMCACWLILKISHSHYYLNFLLCYEALLNYCN